MATVRVEGYVGIYNDGGSESCHWRVLSNLVSYAKSSRKRKIFPGALILI